eukprot:TRINITY_DN224_c0_g1_i2.p1 TRINITY_DN224_c0_g1~~TRINITY_DN224_c0_g1_i2.p1  ORF type:complete len:223 (+),score=21.07 TRINITY_DN224_c0_g1_i2:104-772(+)
MMPAVAMLLAAVVGASAVDGESGGHRDHLGLLQRAAMATELGYSTFGEGSSMDLEAFDAQARSLENRAGKKRGQVLHPPRPPSAPGCSDQRKGMSIDDSGRTFRRFVSAPDEQVTPLIREESKEPCLETPSCSITTPSCPGTVNMFLSEPSASGAASPPSIASAFSPAKPARPAGVSAIRKPQRLVEDSDRSAAAPEGGLITCLFFVVLACVSVNITRRSAQ